MATIQQLKTALRETADPVARANLKCALDAAVQRASDRYRKEQFVRVVSATFGTSHPEYFAPAA